MISTIGFGRSSVKGRSRSPLPPASTMAYIRSSSISESTFRGATFRAGNFLNGVSKPLPATDGDGTGTEGRDGSEERNARPLDENPSSGREQEDG